MILFKAKRKDNKECVEGYIYQSDKQSWITSSSNININTHRNFAWHEVIPETVCQFVNLTDKDGVKIFSNDLRIDSDGVIFRIYSTFGGFVMKAHYWKKDTNDLVPSDELIFEHLSNPQTADWVCNSTTHYGNANDKI